MSLFSKIPSEFRGAVSGAIVAAIISGMGSVATFFYTDRVSHERTAKTDVALAFSNQGFSLTPLAAKYIAAISGGRPLDQLRIDIRSAATKEIYATDSLKPLLGENDGYIDRYQRSLVAFTATLDSANSPTQMRKWAEAFGKASDAHQELQAHLLKSIGV